MPITKKEKGYRKPIRLPWRKQNNETHLLKISRDFGPKALYKKSSDPILRNLLLRYLRPALKSQSRRHWAILDAVLLESQSSLWGLDMGVHC